MMRAQVVRNGANRVDFLKTLGDGRSDPFQGRQDFPIYEEESLAVGVLICRDYENNGLRARVLEHLRSSRSTHSVLCVPADMHGAYFESDPGLTFAGTFVALSNHRKTYKNPWRCRSFIADARGAKICQQTDYESILVDIL